MIKVTNKKTGKSVFVTKKATPAKTKGSRYAKIGSKLNKA